MPTAMPAKAPDPVMSAIRGAQTAEDVIRRVREGCGAPDALHEALVAAVAANEPDLLRAFARQCQKALEQRG